MHIIVEGCRDRLGKKKSFTSFIYRLVLRMYILREYDTEAEVRERAFSDAVDPGFPK